MAGIKRVRSGDKELITVSGDLTVQNAKTLKEALLDAIRTAPAVVLAVERVSELDVAFPQLVCSLHRSAADLNKQLTISGLDEEPMGRLLRQAGFLRHIGCHESTRKSCLWMRSEGAN